MRTTVYLILLAMALAACCAAAAETPAPIQLVLVQPTKILYDLGEPVTGTVTMKNGAKTPQVVTVRAWLEWQLDKATRPKEVKLTIEPEKTATATFTWEKLTEQFGYALKAEVLVGGQVVAAGEDYFQISDNYWKVSLINAFGSVGQVLSDTDYSEQWILQTLTGWRRDYYNGFEKFFWAPDDVLEMTPEMEQWYSSVGHYPENKSGLKRFIEEAHRIGMKAITYERYSGGGSHGLEIARRRPEWVQQSNGTLGIRPEARVLEEWDKAKPTGLRGWVEIRWNLSLPSAMDAAIKELADSTAMFGWDGARWDGTFSEPTEWYDLDGKLGGKLTSEEAEAKNAENFRRTKAYVSARFPRFVYGNNWVWHDFVSSFSAKPRESIELCRGGGLVMNEFIRNAAQAQWPQHKWEDYARTLVNDAEIVRQLGGYYGPILDLYGPGADSQYKCIFAYAAGAHPYYHHLWGSFVTRYSWFLWDPALTRIAHPESLVMAPDTVWWKQWVFERTLGPDRKQLVIHLINPPAHPAVGESPKPEDVPPPVKNVGVRILPTLPAGWKPVRATRLSPAPQLVEPLPLRDVEGIIMVTVPEIALWNILVIDLNKQEGGR